MRPFQSKTITVRCFSSENIENSEHGLKVDFRIHRRILQEKGETSKAFSGYMGLE